MKDQNEKTLFNYADAPKSWYNCFNSACPKAGECMHFMTGKNVPADVTLGNAIYPNACKNGECRFFKQIRMIRGAYGFNSMLNDLKRKDEELLRGMITDYLGSNTTYYKFNRGEKLLTPEQQEWILALFRKYGYTGEKEFEGYRYIYDFSE